MNAPPTGTIRVPASAGVAPVRSRVRALGSSMAGSVVRTPELTIGALGVLVTAAFAWVPSLWYDEAATVTSAQRTWSQLWAELQSVDAVHGLYYSLMHVWFWLVGYTPFTLRFPSALAIGVAAGLVVALGRRLGGRRLGITAGLVFLALPRVQWAGSEGRPYATITTLAVCLTLVGLTAVRRSRSGRSLHWWVAYGALALVAVTFNVYLSLAVAAHAVTLLWTMAVRRLEVRRASVHRTSVLPGAPLVTGGALLRWAVAAGIAAVAVSPVVVEIASQSKQVSWIAGIGDRTGDQVFATAWFGSVGLYAAVAWTLMVFGVAAVLVEAHRRSPSVRALVRAQAVRVAVPLVVLPTAALVLATAMGKHLYSPKYATLSLPFVALLTALALTFVRPKALLAGAVAVVLVLSVPTAVAVKEPLAKQGSTWARAASIITAERSANRVDADEGVVFGSVYGHPGTTADIIRVSYPSAFTGMTDLGVRKVGAEAGVLWNQTGDLASTIPNRLDDIDTVWFVGGTVKARDIEPETASVLAAHGFTTKAHWTTGTVVITEFVRR
ncbi:glycosyltransferase family 39 protein [Curtobacterium sp. MCPF17_002]|uniref:glycosyltransferase family 39 protein n=1 Tax=Curtobacterium sp. MCPF17_002 TaxID=2175645 RepID=UPI000DAA9067|nr:glycosyltransferase family 39 protein [Curtobacterium sp. MCPF17_002]WIB76843.1 glycosyltransferase family 39 protein [Curtobacterium sp. MCPF17_002]